MSLKRVCLRSLELLTQRWIWNLIPLHKMKSQFILVLLQKFPMPCQMPCSLTSCLATLYSCFLLAGSAYNLMLDQQALNCDDVIDFQITLSQLKGFIQIFFFFKYDIITRSTVSGQQNALKTLEVPAVAGCSTVHKPLPLHAGRLDTSQTLKTHS